MSRYRDTAWAMSQENVEIVRRVTAEFTESHKVLSELVAPDSIWDMRSWPSWSGQPQFHGRDGFMEFFAEWTGAYEEWGQEIEDIIDAGDNQVLEVNRQRGRLRGSNSWVALRLGILYTLKNGLITRAEVYASPEEALDAAGLSE